MLVQDESELAVKLVEPAPGSGTGCRSLWKPVASVSGDGPRAALGQQGLRKGNEFDVSKEGKPELPVPVFLLLNFVESE